MVTFLLCPPTLARFAVVATSIACSVRDGAAAEGPGVASSPSAFAIQVVDQETKRGVPLVELTMTTNQSYVTDSHGYVAIDDPAVMGKQAFFHVSSHGYEHAKDGFGYRGKAFRVMPGEEVVIKIRRNNIAERLYRITGAGIYRDSVKLGRQVPLKKPLFNALVTGQDSVQTAVVGDRIYWFWGDTNRLRYPLGQFHTSGAISTLPSAGGLDPDKGIDLQYFEDDSGFSRPMFQKENGVLIWVHGVFTVQQQATTRILTHYSRRKSLQRQLSHGLAVFDENQQRFEPIVEFAADEKLYPRGHSFRVQKQGVDYVYFADPYAVIRFPATWDAAVDTDQYEAFTPLVTGSRSDHPSNLETLSDGGVHYAWKRATPPVGTAQLQRWQRDGVMNVADNWHRTIDAETGKTILLHRGSIHWNRFRKRWIMIAHQTGGSTSFLGEVWYTEAQEPEGPFRKAVKIVTHDSYSFYNVTHHDFFDQQRGQLIYFEGTYTNLFTKDVPRTPWYDYNQIMYRLDLDDPRLKPAFVE